jgi:hypothetical protein
MPDVRVNQQVDVFAGRQCPAEGGSYGFRELIPLVELLLDEALQAAGISRDAPSRLVLVVGDDFP